MLRTVLPYFFRVIQNSLHWCVSSTTELKDVHSNNSQINNFRKTEFVMEVFKQSMGQI